MSSFKKVVKDFADTNEWPIEWDGDLATIEFEAESGNAQTLYIGEGDGVVEFDVPSAAAFDSENAVPDEACKILLKRNVLLPVGAWVLEEIDDQWCFSVMYNEDLEVLNNMEYDELADRVATLVEECDEFDRLWEKLVSEKDK